MRVGYNTSYARGRQWPVYMKGRIVNDIESYSGDPARARAARARQLSPRVFNFAVSGLIFLGFCVMGLGTYFTGTMTFARMMYSGSGAMGFILGTLIGTVVGIFVMSAGAKRQSVAMSLVGYALFASTCGLMASTALIAYDLPTINTAFAATAAVTVVFGALGVTFPNLFKRIPGVLCGALLGLILVELVLAIAGVPQTVTDYLVVIVFAGFIGFDTYQATQVEPTLPNAVMAATNLFLDIINVFMRILAIVGNRD